MFHVFLFTLFGVPCRCNVLFDVVVNPLCLETKACQNLDQPLRLVSKSCGTFCLTPFPQNYAQILLVEVFWQSHRALGT